MILQLRVPTGPAGDAQAGQSGLHKLAKPESASCLVFTHRRPVSGGLQSPAPFSLHLCIFSFPRPSPPQEVPTDALPSPPPPPECHSLTEPVSPHPDLSPRWPSALQAGHLDSKAKAPSSTSEQVHTEPAARKTGAPVGPAEALRSLL